MIKRNSLNYFFSSIHQVRRDSLTSNDWSRVGDITKKEIPHRGNVRDRLDLQFQDTYYRIVLQAHNQLGFSPESSIIIKTKKGKHKSLITKHRLDVLCLLYMLWILLKITNWCILDAVRGSSVIAPPSMLNSVPTLHLKLPHHLILLATVYCLYMSTFT